MSESVNYIYSSIKGTKHKENWDNLLIVDESKYSIFAVFDGVSSASDGKQASITAKEFIKAEYKKYLGLAPDIRKLMYELNQHLINSNLPEPYSTYCMVVYNKVVKTYHYSWLGDSRLYVITNQFIEQITEDDSYSENIITKFLGHSNLQLSDFRQISNDKMYEHLLLCTDGFYRILEKNRLAFFDFFRKKSLPSIKKGINSLIKGNNFDDSTFIFVK